MCLFWWQGCKTVVVHGEVWQRVRCHHFDLLGYHVAKLAKPDDTRNRNRTTAGSRDSGWLSTPNASGKNNVLLSWKHMSIVYIPFHKYCSWPAINTYEIIRTIKKSIKVLPELMASWKALSTNFPLTSSLKVVYYLSSFFSYFTGQQKFTTWACTSVADKQHNDKFRSRADWPNMDIERWYVT